ncbi:MAG: DUF177 domain-containing protein [Mogibacterium sp.]|nr:DUF177 domain-containing protein [Mogibacterium sp.]
MKKLRISRIIICAVLAAAMLVMAGCSGTEQTADPGIADGTYVATFKTDNSMFHVCEANQDRGILTVADGKMTIHAAADIRFSLPCDRCLTPVAVEVPLDFTREVDLRKTPEERARELDEQPYVIGTDLDVDLLAEDELISNLPMKVLCREDCKGLCRVCGCNRNITACSCDDHSSEDLRMSVIREIFNQSKEV